MKFTFEQAKETALKALAPLVLIYVDPAAREALAQQVQVCLRCV